MFPDFKIPETLGKLNQYWEKSKAKALSQTDQSYLGSGSNVTQTQFYAMRIVIKKDLKASEFDKITTKKTYNLDTKWKEATELVEKSAEFRAYFELLDNGTRIEEVHETSKNCPGSLKSVKVAQEQILFPESDDMVSQEQTLASTRSKRKLSTSLTNLFIKRGEKPANKNQSEGEDDQTSDNDSDRSFEGPMEGPKNETTPQAALILLFQAISSLVDHPRVQWVYDHVHFEVSSGNRSFNAYTDGALHCNKTHSVQCIIEVKKFPRGQLGERIRLQESSEYVGWYVYEGEWALLLNGQ